MPRARTPRGRLRQVEQWLRATFPMPNVPVRVQVRRLSGGNLGFFHHTGQRFSITIAPGPLDRMIDTLLHEWAHLLSWSPTLESAGDFGHEHPDEFGLWYARLWRKWIDEGGMDDANEYPASPWQ